MTSNIRTYSYCSALQCLLSTKTSCMLEILYIAQSLKYKYNMSNKSLHRILHSGHERFLQVDRNLGTRDTSGVAIEDVNLNCCTVSALVGMRDASCQMWSNRSCADSVDVDRKRRISICDHADHCGASAHEAAARGTRIAVYTSVRRTVISHADDTVAS